MQTQAWVRKPIPATGVAESALGPGDEFSSIRLGVTCGRRHSPRKRVEPREGEGHRSYPSSTKLSWNALGI